jgi:tripartite ATP-independent transporter DctM subunit
MDWSYSLIIAIVLMLTLFFVGIPVFATFLIINVVGVFLLIGNAGLGMLVNSIYQSVTNTTLAAVPLFIIMGEVLFRSGSVDILIDSVNKLVGKVRGRGYYLINVLSAIFGALCGSPVAVAALLGRTVMVSMTRRGYDVRLTSGAILGGATLAAIIPPSLGVIILGSMVNVSIADLLVAGIMPGLLLSCLIVVYIWIRIFRDNDLEPSNVLSADEQGKKGDKLKALARMLPFSLVIFSVMGMIMLGIATPSESAATGVVGAMIVAAIYRKLTLKMLTESILSSASITAVLIVILLSSKFFGQLLSFTGASSGLLRAVTSLDLSFGMMFLVLLGVPFILCMFIDLFAIMMVAIPIYLPIVNAYAYDPIWFWMLFLINLVLGSMTPPFGYTLFSLKSTAPSVSLRDIYAGAWPMVAIFLFGMALMFWFPAIITTLPTLLRG